MTNTTQPLELLWATLSRQGWTSTDRRNWRELLGSEFLAASRWLRPTGRVVDAVDCPFPSGDGCPRRVVAHSDGRQVAVCGDRPVRCATVDLAPGDLEVLAFVIDPLLVDLRILLGLAPPRPATKASNIVPVGVLPLQAGTGVPVLLASPSRNALSRIDVPNLGPGDLCGLLLTVSGEAAGELGDRWRQISLSDLIGIDHAGRPVISGWGHAVLEDIRRDALDNSSQQESAMWRLPADATWGELQMEFTADDVLNVRFRSLTRRFEPALLGMMDRRTGRPDSQWFLLKTIAEGRGTLKPNYTREHAKFLKHKQGLSRTLQNHFGLTTDPIPHDRRTKAYAAKFVIRSAIPSSPSGGDPDENEKSF